MQHIASKIWYSLLLKKMGTFQCVGKTSKREPSVREIRNFKVFGMRCIENTKWMINSCPSLPTCTFVESLKIYLFMVITSTLRALGEWVGIWDLKTSHGLELAMDQIPIQRPILLLSQPNAFFSARAASKLGWPEIRIVQYKKQSRKIEYTITRKLW